MRFTRLLTAADVRVQARVGDADVQSVVADSRRATPGSCFVAIHGPDQDGHAYIDRAIAAGAVAVVCQGEASVPSGVATARVADSAAAAGPVAQAFHGWPGRKLTLVGVTGTKGKTTFTYLVRHILQSVGAKTGLIGSICYSLGDRSTVACNTTPGAVELAGLMAEMAGEGATHLAMEVSSHALDQRRVSGLDFSVAAFTNLSGDHLDYHQTMERYQAAKRRLFEGLRAEAVAVLNRDDPAWEAMARATPAKVMGYGFDPGAEVRACLKDMDAGGTRFDLSHDGGTARVSSSLLGRHNVSHCLAAAGACLSLGVPLEAIAGALSRPISVPGRYQRVPSAAPFEVLVDYAHTDDALDNALGALRPLIDGKLIVLFGCGGDRDRTKRSRMARVAQERADRIVVTHDNPRTEDPQQILDDILAGFDGPGRAKLQVQPDRRAAIALALDRAGTGDVVVLAGKGHETYQILGRRKVPFDDAEIAAALLAERFGPVAAGRGRP